MDDISSKMIFDCAQAIISDWQKNGFNDTTPEIALFLVEHAVKNPTQRKITKKQFEEETEIMEWFMMFPLKKQMTTDDWHKLWKRIEPILNSCRERLHSP